MRECYCHRVDNTCVVLDRPYFISKREVMPTRGVSIEASTEAAFHPFDEISGHASADMLTGELEAIIMALESKSQQKDHELES